MLKRIAHAFLAFSFAQGIAIFSTILLVPLYLHKWSPVLYGEWLALYSAVAYLSNLDFGVSTYAVNRLTQAYARGDLEEYRAVQRTAFAFYVGLAAVLSIFVALFAFLAPIRSWLGLVAADQRTVSMVVLLLGVVFLWKFPGAFLYHLYATTGDLPRSQWVWNAGRILTVTLTVGALVFRPTLTMMASAEFGGFLLAHSFVLWDVSRRYPALVPGFRGAQVSLVWPILKESIFFAVIALSVGAGLQGANIVVASLMGGAAVALFATTRTLANSIRQLVSLFVSSSSTDLTRLDASEDKRRLPIALRMLVFLTVAASVAVSASLWFEGASVFETWTRGRLPANVWLLRGFLAWLVLQSPWIAASGLPLYTNKHKRLALSYVASNVGGLGLAILLVRHFGLVSIPVAFIASEALACYHFVIRDACVIAGDSYARFATRLWLGLAGVGTLALVATWSVHQVGLGNLPRWICSGAASVIAVICGVWLFWLRREDRTFVRQKAAGGMAAVSRSFTRERFSDQRA